MAEPRIYSRNWVDANSVISSTHGGTAGALFDRGTAVQFVTTGANSDATTFELTIEFFEGGVSQTRVIDTLFLLNHNLKTWTFYRWDGSAWQSVTNQAADATTSRYAAVTQFSATKVKLSATATMTTNQEKAIGEIVLCGVTLAADDLASYDTKWREKTKEIVLGDGAIHRVITRAVSGRNGRYEARCRWSYLSKAMRDNFKALKESGQPFLWQPESVNVPEEVYYVHWTNAWDDKYMSNYKGAGYEVVMDLKEV